MSVGSPGICGLVDSCLQGDAVLDLNNEIVRIHVTKRIKPEDFLDSYLYIYSEQRASERPEVKKVMIGEDECEAFVDLPFPIYDEHRQRVGERPITVVFTDQALKNTIHNYLCATVNEEGRVVGEELVEAAASL